MYSYEYGWTGKNLYNCVVRLIMLCQCFLATSRQCLPSVKVRCNHVYVHFHSIIVQLGVSDDSLSPRASYLLLRFPPTVPYL